MRAPAVGRGRGRQRRFGGGRWWRSRAAVARAAARARVVAAGCGVGRHGRLGGGLRGRAVRAAAAAGDRAARLAVLRERRCTGGRAVRGQGPGQRSSDARCGPMVSPADRQRPASSSARRPSSTSIGAAGGVAVKQLEERVAGRRSAGAADERPRPTGLRSGRARRRVPRSPQEVVDAGEVDGGVADLDVRPVDDPGDALAAVVDEDVIAVEIVVEEAQPRSPGVVAAVSSQARSRYARRSWRDGPSNADARASASSARSRMRAGARQPWCATPDARRHLDRDGVQRGQERRQILDDRRRDVVASDARLPARELRVPREGEREARSTRVRAARNEGQRQATCRRSRVTAPARAPAGWRRRRVCGKRKIQRAPDLVGAAVPALLEVSHRRVGQRRELLAQQLAHDVFVELDMAIPVGRSLDQPSKR